MEWLKHLTAEKTIILMETLLIIIQEIIILILQKQAVLFNIHNYWYSMDIELIRIDTWPIDTWASVRIDTGHKQPIRLN